MNYALYLESGPRRKKTMVHVLDLLGCIARGTTTGEALEATPGAIRDFLRFLQRHGDRVDPEAEFSTAIAEHVMEGPWLGDGNPEPGFAPDFEPLTLEEQGALLDRLGWLRDDLLEMISSIPPDQLLAEPEGRGRPIIKIVDHIADAQGAYLRAGLGPAPELAPALRAVRQGPETMPAALSHLWALSMARLRAMSEKERTRTVRRGQKTWSARRALRRMLEHDWEHLVEIRERLGE